MNTEEFLRDHMGLKGEFYSDAYKDVERIEDRTENEKAYLELINGDEYDVWNMFTPSAWELWGKALRLLESLQKEGYIGDGPNGSFYQFFWDSLPECK